MLIVGYKGSTNLPSKVDDNPLLEDSTSSRAIEFEGASHSAVAVGDADEFTCSKQQK